jgi:hypothetical protein
MRQAFTNNIFRLAQLSKMFLTLPFHNFEQLKILQIDNYLLVHLSLFLPPLPLSLSLSLTSFLLFFSPLFYHLSPPFSIVSQSLSALFFLSFYIYHSSYNILHLSFFLLSLSLSLYSKGIHRYLLNFPLDIYRHGSDISPS